MSKDQHLYMILFWNGDRWEPSSVAFATLKKATDSLSKATEAKPTAPHEIVCITAPPVPRHQIGSLGECQKCAGMVNQLVSVNGRLLCDGCREMS